VDRETGARLAESLGQAVTLDLVAETAPGWESHNVVATLPGDDDRRPVTVTAHYDSWDTSESAIDNALGVATLALLAERAAASPRRARSIRFLVTTGEEQGLAGAFRWVADHPDEARSTALVLNLDIPWAGEGAYLVTATDPASAAVALDVAAAEGLAPVDAGAPSPASDHLPFEQLGVPAVWLTRWPDRHYHTHADVADAFDPHEAAAAARVNWAVLAAAAGLE
jgi:aminopeptidase YwaD